jgi:hydrogenase maturation protease
VTPTLRPIAPPRRVVVLGIGNTLLADEGVGVHAALALQQGWALPAGVEVIDGGTAGMELLGPLADVDLLLVLDAVKAGRAPGGAGAAGG